MASTLDPGTRLPGRRVAAQAPGRGAFRSGTAVGLLGVASCLPVYLVIYHLQSRGQSAAAIAMSSMHMSRMGVFWAFPLLQAAGIGALAWSYLGIVLGLAVSGRPPRWWRLNGPQTSRLHRQISLLVLALIAVHALATAEDAMGDSLRTAFLPWQASWTAAVFAYNLGIFALYLAVLVGPTYYLRHRIGTRWWMLAHRAALAVYILSVWHALLLGADFSYYSWLRTITWLAQIPLLGLLIYRLLKTRHHGPVAVGSRRYWLAPARYWLAAVSAVAIMAVVVLAALCHLTHLTGGPRTWAWHGAHVLMAAGMIDMLASPRVSLVPPIAGEITFAAATLAAAAICAIRWQGNRPAAVLALVTGADLAIMAYMFAAPGGGSTWLTCLLCASLSLEAGYWASGRLGTLVGHAGVRPTGRQEPQAKRHQRTDWKVSLALLCLCMAYMVLAMHGGTGTPTGSPGMGGMPGMISGGTGS